MAIKVTGTTVINDSREVENVSDINRFIKKPEIISPVDSSTDNIVGLTIDGSLYAPLYTADERLYREFYIDLDSGDFSNPQRSTQIDSDNFDVIEPTLDPEETYKVRIRDVSINGTVSEYSDVVTFTTSNVIVEQPTITTDRASLAETFDAFTSDFSVINDTDTHEYTDWEVIRTSDSAVVFSSFNDTTNLTSITVPEGVVVENTEYEIRARHRGTTYGLSNYGSVTRTSFQDFNDFNYIGQATAGGFYMGTICAASTCYYLIVAPNSSGCACCAWSFDSESSVPNNGTCDGFANTAALNSSDFFAARWAATRSINGFSDWYLPARDELLEFYNNGAGNGVGDPVAEPLPSGEDYAISSYWTSTTSGTGAVAVDFTDGDFGTAVVQFKCGERPTRAVRRVPI